MYLRMNIVCTLRRWSILLRLATPTWQHNTVYIIITFILLLYRLILCLDIFKSSELLVKTCCTISKKEDVKIKMFLFCKFIAITSEEEQITCVTTWRFLKMFSFCNV